MCDACDERARAAEVRAAHVRGQAPDPSLYPDAVSFALARRDRAVDLELAQWRRAPVAAFMQSIRTFEERTSTMPVKKTTPKKEKSPLVLAAEEELRQLFAQVDKEEQAKRDRLVKLVHKGDAKTEEEKVELDRLIKLDLAERKTERRRQKRNAVWVAKHGQPETIEQYGKLWDFEAHGTKKERRAKAAKKQAKKVRQLAENEHKAIMAATKPHPAEPEAAPAVSADAIEPPPRRPRRPRIGVSYIVPTEFVGDES